MDASRFWTLGHEQGETVEVYGNFLPGQTQEQAKSWFMEQATDNPRRSLLKTWAQQIPERFAEALCSHVECDPRTAVAQLPRKDRDRLLAALTKFKLPVTHDRGWNYAEVTAGGVPLEEINFQDDGIQAGAGPLSDWGDPRLRWSDRWVQLSMGLGDGISGWPGGRAL